MRTVVFAINATADGFFGHEDGIADEELHEYHTGVLRRVDVLVCGRKTYELMVPYWPDVARNPSETGPVNEFAVVFDALEKIVFSTTLARVGDHHTKLKSGNLVETVIALKRQPGKDIGIGGLNVASQLSARGLIDEYHFVVHPVVAGKGPRMFENVTPPKSQRLELIETRTFGSGAVALRYRTLS